VLATAPVRAVLLVGYAVADDGNGRKLQSDALVSMDFSRSVSIDKKVLRERFREHPPAS
jgi:hypothetical protein